ncbi:MAG: efflux RND transporter periplasmic adaptor subunit [Bacteroidales bacterium]
MQHSKTLFGSGLIIAVLLLYSCNSHVSPDNNSAQKFCIPDSLLKNVTFDTIKKQAVYSELALSGKIAFNEDKVSRIFPMVSGHVAEVKVSLGDYVEKGKVLAVIRSSDMANYFNEFRSSQSELAIAKKNLEVTSNMRSSGVSSEKDYLVAQNEYQKALAQYNKIKEVLTINGSSFPANDSTGSGYLIKAPISGFVVDKNVTTGMDIRPDATDNLFTISDLRELWATANVYETDISKIRIGSEAIVTTLSYPDKKFTGKIERISSILDPETKLMNVKIGLRNPEYLLKPGMFAQIAIRFPDEKKMLAVKTNTIIFDDNKSFVLYFRTKCDISIQQVTILKSFNGVSFIECDSMHESDLAVARNGLFIYTALKNY